MEGGACAFKRWNKPSSVSNQKDDQNPQGQMLLKLKKSHS